MSLLILQAGEEESRFLWNVGTYHIPLLMLLFATVIISNFIQIYITNVLDNIWEIPSLNLGKVHGYAVWGFFTFSSTSQGENRELPWNKPWPLSSKSLPKYPTLNNVRSWNLTNNQSIDYSINQLINWPIDQLIHQSVNHSINQSIHQPLYLLFLHRIKMTILFMLHIVHQNSQSPLLYFHPQQCILPEAECVHYLLPHSPPMTTKHPCPTSHLLLASPASQYE